MKIQQLPYQTTEIDFQIPTLGQYPVPLDSWDHLNLTHYRYDVKQILVLEDARTGVQSKIPESNSNLRFSN